jgi:ATP-dependent helicase/DNAse subunit B
MDKSEEVVKNSDVNIKDKTKSKYFEAYLNYGKQPDGAMSKDDFNNFISYSVMVASKGAEELYGGNIIPSPTEKACDFCNLAGCCGFSPDIYGVERETISIKCKNIAHIAKKQKEEN